MPDPKLNPQQLLAVNQIKGSVLVLAGAGTGKTKVLTHRIANIIKTGIDPNNILAVTFTNKAAKEMSYRVTELVKTRVSNIGTFHSIAMRIIRLYTNLINPNLGSNFNIIGQDEQVKLIKNIALRHNIDIKQYTPQIIHSIISSWKDQNILPDQLSDHFAKIYSISATIYPDYQETMIDSSVIDFGDILIYCNKIFKKNPDILESYQDRFKYILVDEYQDTNIAQYSWIEMLARKHKNICCVGDDDQSIYSWRGAEIKNIEKLKKDFPDLGLIKLEQNYRSTYYILKAASSIINHNKKRHIKTLWTKEDKGEKITIASCWNDKEEAKYIAKEILKLTKLNFNLNQISILVRASFQTRIFEEIFIANVLPYQMIKGIKFYDRMEIRDTLAYIRLSINQTDNLAFERIINSPRRSIGNVTLAKIKEFASINSLSMFDATTKMVKDNLFKGKIKDNLENFINIIISANSKFETETGSKTVEFILNKSGYLATLKDDKSDESKTRIENVNEMLNSIDGFKNIYEFIEYTSLAMDNDYLETNGKIKIMTLHSAKGLEFDIVFLPGWEENIFPHQKSLLENNLEEERRIAYVGITRAKKKLYITHAKNRLIFGEIISSIPSRFISEIPRDCYLVNL